VGATSIIDTLRLFERGGKCAGRRVSKVRVYDPAQTETQQDAVTKYAHLDAEPGAIWFSGHVEQDGKVYLRDVRPSLA
jgi:hypothetical protein